MYDSMHIFPQENIHHFNSISENKVLVSFADVVYSRTGKNLMLYLFCRYIHITKFRKLSYILLYFVYSKIIAYKNGNRIEF